MPALCRRRPQPPHCSIVCQPPQSPPGRLVEAIAALKSCPGVVYAEPNYVVSAAETIPNDTYWANQNGLRAIRAPQAWDLSTGSSAVTIAVVDSGVDLAHVDLAGKITPRLRFCQQRPHSAG